MRFCLVPLGEGAANPPEARKPSLQQCYQLPLRLLMLPCSSLGRFSAGQGAFAGSQVRAALGFGVGGGSPEMWMSPLEEEREVDTVRPAGLF